MVRQLHDSETSVARRVVIVSTETKKSVSSAEHEWLYSFEADPTNIEALKNF
jgi:hypothetical protein